MGAMRQQKDKQEDPGNRAFKYVQDVASMFRKLDESESGARLSQTYEGSSSLASKDAAFQNMINEVKRCLATGASISGDQFYTKRDNALDYIPIARAIAYSVMLLPLRRASSAPAEFSTARPSTKQSSECELCSALHSKTQALLAKVPDIGTGVAKTLHAGKGF